MSIETEQTGREQREVALFDESELRVPPARQSDPAIKVGVPRLMTPQRDQIELRACDLDSLLAADHAARTVWAFVQSLDLAPLHARIRSLEGSAGRPAIDPAILVALWLWATVDGVGSAREVDRLCERDNAYRWLCGGVGVNHHTLADFRTQHTAWLDAQLTRSIASLLERRLVSLNVVAQDGLRVRASAKAASFRRRQRLQQFIAQAQAQVQALKKELDEDAGASTRRKQAALERAVREREQRLAQALATMAKIERKAGAPKPHDDDEPPSGSPAVEEPAKPQPEPRVSTTDPEARVMKMADGGFRPAFNAQLAVDAATQLIAAVAVVNTGSDITRWCRCTRRSRSATATRPSTGWPTAASPSCRRSSTSRLEAHSQCCRPRRVAIRTSTGSHPSPPTARIWRSGERAWPAPRGRPCTGNAGRRWSAPMRNCDAVVCISSMCAGWPRPARCCSGTRSLTTSCAWRV